jgi:hypothetical protein
VPNFGPSIGNLKPVKPPKLNNVIPMPKPIKVAAPKIANIHVTKGQGGYVVKHNMTHPPQPKPFVFSDPHKMANHLKRIESSAWRQPDRNEGTAIDKTLNLNSGQGTSSW